MKRETARKWSVNKEEKDWGSWIGAQKKSMDQISSCHAGLDVVNSLRKSARTWDARKPYNGEINSVLGECREMDKTKHDHRKDTRGK